MIISLCFQGEKAYSCAQCGTRFTYRNGLIKHTKLNRCPKKIVTPEGETIIKKRSRTFGPSKASCPKEKSNPPELGQPQPPLDQPQSHLPQSQPQPPPPSSVNGTLLLQNNQIQLQTHAGTYGLALLEDGSLIATPQQQQQVNSALLPPQATVPTAEPPASHSKLLNQSVITALSAATGLSAQDISTWAANLPAGSTVKVTHHFDHTAPPKIPSSFDHVSPPPPSVKTVTRSPTATGGISSEMASACCHDSLISSCVGLPSYQESFAVDPNEVLSKDRIVKTCHVEPSLANSRLLNVPELSTMSNDFDIDLDDIDDLDISLNDQEFTSIRSIVEQTFKDGRDVLDIISAV